MKKLQKEADRTCKARGSTTKKRSQIGIKLRPQAVLNLVEMRGHGGEVLESLIAGHRAKFDWYGEGEYFLSAQEALELLELSGPVHYSGRFGEVVLEYSQGAGWKISPGL